MKKNPQGCWLFCFGTTKSRLWLLLLSTFVLLWAFFPQWQRLQSFDTPIINVYDKDIFQGLNAHVGIVAVANTTGSNMTIDLRIDSLLKQNLMMLIQSASKKMVYSIFIGYTVAHEVDNIFRTIFIDTDFDVFPFAAIRMVPCYEQIGYEDLIACTASHAFSDESVDFFFRVPNHRMDSLPTDWSNMFISDLMQMSPPYVGVTGQVSHVYGKPVIIADFVHRLHYEIFEEVPYPVALPEKYIAVWITYIYFPDNIRGILSPARPDRAPDSEHRHFPWKAQRLRLNFELKRSQQLVQAFFSEYVEDINGILILRRTSSEDQPETRVRVASSLMMQSTGRSARNITALIAEHFSSTRPRVWKPYPLELNLSPERRSTEPDEAVLLNTSSRVGRAGDIRPVTWLHVPKTGTSFHNTLANWGCDVASDGSNSSFRPPTASTFLKDRSCNVSTFRRFEAGHAPIARNIDAMAMHHVVTMARNPRNRLLSGYVHQLHDCHALQREFNCAEHKPKLKCIDRYDDDLMARYSKCVGMCSTAMLLGERCNSDIDWPNTPSNAPQWYADNIGFVGLTEFWNVSVCLWHIMYGGKCIPEEMLNLRPGNYSGSPAHIMKYVHPRERTTYSAMVKRFWHDVHTYDVSPASCLKIDCKL